MYGIPFRPEYTLHLAESSKEISPSPESGILDALIGERVRFLNGVVEALRKQIRERESLGGRIKEAVTQEWLEGKARLYELDPWPYGASKTIEQRRQGIEKALGLLEAESRQEETACFRDIALLKRDLREWEQRYQDASRRFRVISGGMDDEAGQEEIPVQPGGNRILRSLRGQHPSSD